MTQSGKAIMACGHWLAFCKSIGWQHSDLDELERIWWKHHDDNGNILQVPRADAEIAGDRK